MNVKNYRTTPKAAITHSPGGTGTIRYTRLWDKKDFVSQWNFVDHVTMPPGSSIGVHTHGENEEMYVILSGRGMMTVNGETRSVVAGDTILNPAQGTHGLVNDSAEELELLVVEVLVGR